MRRLILNMAEGSSYDAALEEIYGFNSDGLDSAWRASIGAPSRSPPPTPTPVTAAGVPTAIPIVVAQSVPTPDGEALREPGIDRPSTAEPFPNGLCGLGLLPLLSLSLSAGVAAKAQRSSRSRRKRG